MDIEDNKNLLNVKLLFFFVFILLDLISSTFVETHFNYLNQQSYKMATVIAFAIVQIVINFVVVVLFLILMW